LGGKGGNYGRREETAIGMSYCVDCTLHGAEMRNGGASGRRPFKPIFFKIFPAYDKNKIFFTSHWNNKC
jgi:hypothetical protein